MKSLELKSAKTKKKDPGNFPITQMIFPKENGKK